MAITATDARPERHVELSDLSGTPVVRLMLVDSQGNQNPFNITRSKYARSATKIAQGTGGKYSDLELPYENIVQSDFSGGISSRDFEDDKTRILDAWGVNTEVENQVVLGPLPSWSKGYGDAVHAQVPSSVLEDGSDLITVAKGGLYDVIYNQFTPTENIVIASGDKSYILCRAVVEGTTWTKTDTITIYIYNDDGAGLGKPSTLRIAANAVPWSEIVGPGETSSQGDVEGKEGEVGQWFWLPFTWSAGTTLTSGTKYHIVIAGNANDIDGTRYLELARGTLVPSSYAVGGYSNDGGSTWTSHTEDADNYSYFFVITNNSNDHTHKLFRYRGAQYALRIPNNGSSASSIYLNGDRGAADSNTGSLTTLIDASQSWTADEWINAVVKIVEGPGSEEEQPWRVITDNDATTLTVDTAWKIEHTTATRYVILGSDKWTLQTSVGAWVNELAVAGKFVYFGNGDNLYGWIQYANAGAWQAAGALITEGTDFKASFLTAIREPERDRYTLWGVDNKADLGTEYWRASVPRWMENSTTLGYNLRHETGILVEKGRVWNEVYDANLTHSQGVYGSVHDVASGFTTGRIAAINLDTPIDLSDEAKLSYSVRTDVSMPSNTWKFEVWDKRYEDLDKVADAVLLAKPGRKRRAASVGWRRNKSQPPASVKLLDRSGGSGAGTYTDHPAAHDFINGTVATMTITTDDRLLIGANERFNRIFVSFGTPNSVANTMTLQTYNDSGRVEGVPGTVTDGTDSGPSFGQDGTISFDMPAIWNQFTIDGVSAYWACMFWDVNLTASITIERITVWDDNQGIYIDLPLAYDGDFKERKSAGDSATVEDIYIFRTDEYLYVCGSEWYDEVHFAFLDVNATSSTLSCDIWAEGGWQSITITDGTASSGATFGQDGTVTLKPHRNWEAITFNNTSGYWCRFSVGTATDDFQIEDIQVSDSNEWFYIDLLTDILGANDAVNMPVITSEDRLLVGSDALYDAVYFEVGTANTAAQAVNGMSYYSPTGRQGMPGSLTDNTKSGSTGFANSGTILRSGMPIDSQPQTIEGETLHWHVFTFNGTLDENWTLTDVRVQQTLPLQQFLHNTLAADLTHNIVQSIALGGWEGFLAAKSCSINLISDRGAQEFQIVGDVETLREGPQRFSMGENKRINDIAPYGRERINPWIVTEDKLYEIQTENNNAATPIPISGMEALGSEITGRVTVHNDVYVYIPMSGGRLERYFDGSLEDIGPDRDAGLRRACQGEIKAIESYPGKIYAGIDAGSGGHSGVYVRRNSGWHVFHRLPAFDQLEHIHSQVIPGRDNTDRMWVAAGGTILSLPLPSLTFNPIRDPRMKYWPEGSFVTGWITADLIDVDKLFKSIKLFTERLQKGVSSSDRWIEVEYQTDSGEIERTTSSGAGSVGAVSPWTAVGTDFTSSPVQEENLAATFVTAKKIRFRIRLFTTDEAQTPVLEAWLLEALISFPLKFAYTFNFSLSDIQIDWDGTRNFQDIATDDTQLVTWLNSPTPLTFRCPYTPYDNKTVKLESMGSRPIPPLLTEQQFEQHVGEITVLEI